MLNKKPVKTTKICSRKTCRCPYKGMPQPIENFTKQSSSKDGYYPACKACVAAYEESKGIHKYRKDFTKKWKQELAKFDISADNISYCEQVRRDPDNSELLQVQCSLCKNWINPKNGQVHNRTSALDGKKAGESKFYCSEECKKQCQTYRRQTHRKSEAKNYSPMNRDATVQYLSSA